MFLKKLTQAEREAMREKRKEMQRIKEGIKKGSFEYIVNPPEIPRVAFGTTLERVTLPMTGPCLSSFMRQQQGEIRDYPGPFEHHTAQALGKKYPSKLGAYVFSSKSPRIPPPQETDSPKTAGYYIEPPRKFKAVSRPFGSSAKRTDLSVFLTPGPPTYPIHVSYPTTKISSAFGSRRINLPAVAIFCGPYNTAKCCKCGETPFGDYFHNFSNGLDMCRKCMRHEHQLLKRCSTDIFYRMRMNMELAWFKPARYCSFFHEHNGTSAAVQIISTRELHQKIRKENYLYQYQYFN